MGSQKTLPMAMTVLSFFPPSLGEPGLIALPCIVSHLLQIFADAFLVARQPRCRRDAAEIDLAGRRTRLPRREAVGHRPSRDRGGACQDCCRWAAATEATPPVALLRSRGRARCRPCRRRAEALMEERPTLGTVHASTAGSAGAQGGALPRAAGAVAGDGGHEQAPV